MTGVLGMAELLENTNDPRQRRCAEAIRRSGELLLKLVNDALDLARIEAGRFELEPGPVDPRKLLAETRQLLLGQAEGKQLELTAEDRKSTRLNSSHVAISYAVFCLKKQMHAD